MALSQKDYGKMLVPWFNKTEWKTVYDLIYNDESTPDAKSDALEILKIWKLRTPKLPKGVEGSLIVLEALLQKNVLLKEQICVLQGAAIMRFLNLCGAHADKQGTLYKTAKEHNIPDWLVDMRHTFAHNQVLPHENMLQKGLEFCLEWLKDEYWMEQDKSLSDYVISVDEDKVKLLVNLYCEVNLICYWNGTALLLISYPEIYDKFKTVIDGVQEDLNLKDVLELLLGSLKNYVSAEQGVDDNLICDCIVKKGSMLLIEAVKQENGKEETLPSRFVKSWENILNLIYKNNMMSSFIKKLLQLVHEGNCDRKRKIVNLWLLEIFNGLMAVKTLDDNKNNVLPKSDKKQNNKSVLHFDGDNYIEIIKVEESIRWEIVKFPTNFTVKFMELFMKFCNAPESLISKSTDAVRILSGRDLQEGIAIQDRPYSLGNNFSKYAGESIVDENFDFSSAVRVTREESKLNSKNSDKQGWEIVEDVSMFEGCPLGILKTQNCDDNPVLCI